MYDYDCACLNLFFQAEDGIRDYKVTGVQTCALPISKEIAMPVLSTTKDAAALTLTLVADYDATPEKVWQMFADPRKLERWWGPPTWPATFGQHDFTVGGDAGYFMTGPDGEKAFGWWRFTAIDEPKSLEFEEGFSHDSGTPNE